MPQWTSNSAAATKVRNDFEQKLFSIYTLNSLKWFKIYAVQHSRQTNSLNSIHFGNGWWIKLKILLTFCVALSMRQTLSKKIFRKKKDYIQFFDVYVSLQRNLQKKKNEPIWLIWQLRILLFISKWRLSFIRSSGVVIFCDSNFLKDENYRIYINLPTNQMHLTNYFYAFYVIDI